MTALIHLNNDQIISSAPQPAGSFEPMDGAYQPDIHLFPLYDAKTSDLAYIRTLILP